VTEVQAFQSRNVRHQLRDHLVATNVQTLQGLDVIRQRIAIGDRSHLRRAAMPEKRVEEVLGEVNYVRLEEGLTETMAHGEARPLPAVRHLHRLRYVHGRPHRDVDRRLRRLPARPGVFDSAPMLFVHGNADDYAYISDCRAYARRIADAGTPTEFVVLPSARHKFDLDDLRRNNLRNSTKTKEGCPLEYDVVDQTMRDRRTGEALAQDKAQALNRELCADRGRRWKATAWPARRRARP
jgi:acetyl esterase/lipase